MSYHFSFIAVSKEKAFALLDERAGISQPHVPHGVYILIQDAIAALNPAREGHQRLISVEAQGHQHSGSDYEVTSHKIEVKPLDVIL